MPRSRTRRARLGWEALGILLAAAASLAALAHALAGAKRSLLLDDGDSVLLPLLLRSLERGEPFEWGMSPVLFVFPELPLYALSAALTTTVAGALLLNGALNVILLYALLRYVAGRVLRTREGQDHALHPARPVAAAALGTLLFAALCLLETRPGGNSGEIASLYLTTTYYSGTVMALVATLGLVVHLVGPIDRRGRRILLPALGIGLLAAAATLSNPLYALWVTIPLVAALAVLAVVRIVQHLRDPWWRPTATALALVAGSGVGYLARQPLERFIIAQKDEYFRWSREDLSLAFGRDVVRALVATPGGALEAVVAVILLLGALAAAVAVVVRREAGPVAIVALFAGASVILVPLALLVTGSISTRYALPLLFAPLALAVVLVAMAPWPGGGVARSDTGRGRRITALAALLAAGAVVALGLPSGVAVARVAGGSGYAAATCLSDWARGKHVTGVAQFWTGRGLAAYGGDDVHLLQVNSDFSVYPWLVNLAPYRDARVSYVVVARGGDSAGHLEYWGDSVTNLGAPSDIVDCGSYEVYDFRGTPAVRSLTEQVDRSAAVQAAFRGFGW